MTPTIAVVIPNRNDSGPLGKCLDSVLNQDVVSDQIIVVDDQSTDDSRVVIQNKIRNIPGAKIVINPTRLGTMGTLNAGLNHVTCDYVLFLSSNDYLENDIFRRAKSRIAAHGFPGVWSAMVWAVDENGERPRLYPSPVVALSDTYLPPSKCIRLAMSIGHWFTGTTLIYHRQTLQGIGGFDTAYQGLADLFAALTVASIRGASFSPEPLGVMRQHAGGLMWRTSTNLPGLDKILDRMIETGPKLSPKLFGPRFCELMQRRIRFTAIRAFQDSSWQAHAPSWTGYRYKLLIVISPFLGNYRKLQLITAFLLLRP
ncbi:MAG: glycosyltransferase family A protein, partial [Gammaproteobacteria bacterium]